MTTYMGNAIRMAVANDVLSGNYFTLFFLRVGSGIYLHFNIHKNRKKRKTNKMKLAGGNMTSFCLIDLKR